MSDDTKAFLVACLMIILSWVLFFSFGYGVGDSSMKKDAIKNRHAEYKVDENGNPVWQWKAAK